MTLSLFRWLKSGFCERDEFPMPNEASAFSWRFRKRRRSFTESEEITGKYSQGFHFSMSLNYSQGFQWISKRSSQRSTNYWEPASRCFRCQARDRSKGFANNWMATDEVSKIVLGVASPPQGGFA
jgi:hypothetical protein